MSLPFGDRGSMIHIRLDAKISVASRSLTSLISWPMISNPVRREGETWREVGGGGGRA